MALDALMYAQTTQAKQDNLAEMPSVGQGFCSLTFGKDEDKKAAGLGISRPCQLLDMTIPLVPKATLMHRIPGLREKCMNYGPSACPCRIMC